MEINRVHKKIRVGYSDIIRYQIISELVFLKKEHLIDSDIKLLTELVLNQPVELSEFCYNTVKKLYTEIEPEKISIKSQNIRNKVISLQKRGIIVKTNKGKNKIMINPSYNIQSKGNVLLDYNILAIEPNKI